MVRISSAPDLGVLSPAEDTMMCSCKSLFCSCRIVATDSDPAMGPFYEETLSRLGHEVVVTRSGPELVELCQTYCPEVMVTDLDGLAVAPKFIPIILVSNGHDLN